MTGAQSLVRRLQAHGVEFVAVLCGHGLGPFLQAAVEAGLKLVDTRTENTASYIADAYARLTGRLGVCAVSSGVAHVNAFSGLVNAWFDGAPVLLITGAAPSNVLGRGCFQDLDQVALARPVCKHAALVTRADAIPDAVDEAVRAATSGRPGPVHLTITLDGLCGEVGPAGEGQPASRPNGGDGKSAVAEDAAREAAAWLGKAERPIIVAGTGTFYADAGDALLALARAAHVPIVTPIWDRGVIDRSEPLFLGVVGAASGEPRLLEDADLIVMVGARPDYRVRYLERPSLRQDLRVIRVERDPAEFDYGPEPDIALAGEPRLALELLAEEYMRAGYPDHGCWLAEAQGRHRDFYARWASSDTLPSGPMTGGHLVHALSRVIGDDTVLLIDGGNIGQWAHMILCKDRYPSHWLTCGASAVVGWGVGGAMAARLAYPDRPVVLLSGDGSIGFGLVDMETAVRHRLPFVVVLADDSAWGIVVSGQQSGGECIVASRLGTVDYVQVAQGLGARACRADSPEEVSQEVRGAMEAGQVTLVHVPIAVAAPTD